MIARSMRACAFLFAVVLFAAAPARAASITIAPGTIAGYIPLAVFGVNAHAIAADGFTTFDTGGITFGGETLNRVSMAEDGFLILGDPLVMDTTANQSLPAASLPAPILAPFWTDLTGGLFRWATLTDGVAVWEVFEWENVAMAGGATTTFQVWMGVGFEDIAFAYDPSNGPSLPTSLLLTIGAQDRTGTVGSNYFHNGTGSLPDGDLRVSTDGLPVPEPTSMVLLASGLALSAVGRFRKRNA